ncbi:MAG TPA: phosphatase PAP2 family protein [Cyclobacteriaceae bacterium]|nr:phosphatase PAP2 family protein [Cyclobacteriaceae bacterium]
MQQTIKELILWIREFIKNNFHRDKPSLPYYLSILVSFVLFVVSLNVFVELTDDLTANELGPLDDFFSEKVRSLHHPTVTVFFLYITELGDRLAYIILSIVIGVAFYIKFGNWKFTLQSVIVLVLSSLNNVMLKRVINRERPDLEHLVTVSSLSYPSGHAMSAMAFYGFLIYLGFRLKVNFLLKLLISLGLGVLILLIGTSRIYLGVHYPSDVLAGFIGGVIWITFCIIVFNVFDLYRRKKNNITFGRV